MQIGISTFVETTPDYLTGETVSHDQRIREVVAEAELADKVGLDYYGIGEHHRRDFAASNPAPILAAIAVKTNHITLGSAVTVLSSSEPVRVFQDFATVDALSNGRAEIMAGRGSFIESFPLFGYDLNDYHELFEEKLDLLLEIQKNPDSVTWQGSGKFRAPIFDKGVYPLPVQDKLAITIGSGGSPESVIRAAHLGLPLVLAIIGGQPERFAPLVALYYQEAKKAGHDISKLSVSSHSHGFVWETEEEAVEKFYGPTQHVMNIIGRERGWPHYNRASYDHARSPEGALYVGDPETVANKIIALHKNVGIDRFMLHLPLGTMKHEDVMEAIRLLGEEVKPLVEKGLEGWENPFRNV